jgi:hypothetical protein
MRVLRQPFINRTISGINRPNNAAWLACTDATEGQVLYANLGKPFKHTNLGSLVYATVAPGPYAYNTPAGCTDQTIHYYNAATADV